MGEIAYELGDSLYLNITNRCTNDCGFCLRNFGDELRDFNLKLESEPDVDTILDAIKPWMDKTSYSEIVFCGYGEPLIRLDTVLTLAQKLKQRYSSVKLRVDTNGHANLLHPNRQVANELKFHGIDHVSISLNAADSETYAWICKPSFGLDAYPSVIRFITDCKDGGLETQVSIVGIPQLNIDACKEVAQKLGVNLRIRPYRRYPTQLEQRLGPRPQ